MNYPNDKKNNSVLPVLFGLCLLATTALSQNSNFHIYLSFGQSNMEGQGTIEQQDRTVDSRFQMMAPVNCSNLGRTKGIWYPAVPPLCRCYSGLSPADYFGRTLVAGLPSTIKVGIVNVSVAGCKIELFDKDNFQKYVSTVTDQWLKDIINAYDGNPYAYLLAVAKMAQKDGVIKGILMHQGESNGGDNQWPAKVKGVYDNLLNDLGLKPNSIPLLAGEVVNADQGGVVAGMNSIIGTLPQVVPTAYIISSAGCTAGSDRLHFNSSGYRELGRRYAEKMLSLLATEPNVVLGLEAHEPTPGYSLGQNFPNPFYDKTSISFEIPERAFVSLKVLNMLGIETAELAGREYSAGKHTVEFNSLPFAKGLYLYRMTAGPFIATSKLTIVE